MKKRSPFIFTVLVVLALIVTVFYMLGGVDAFESLFTWGFLVIAILMLLLGNGINQLIEHQEFDALNATDKQTFLKASSGSYWADFISSMYKRQTDEEEKDIIIDHDFDGILELDNSLPQWWVALFKFGVAFCVIYLMAFFFTDFAHPDVEFQTEWNAGVLAVAKFEETAEQITIENAKFKDANIAEGKKLFEATCATCHQKNGGGISGPNLTDDYWINTPEKDLFKNVFQMVWSGSPNNPAMQAFGENGLINGRKIEKIAAYVYHLNQEMGEVTKEQGGKAAQGERVDWNSLQAVE